MAGIAFLLGAYYFGFARTYVIYYSYPTANYPIEVKGVGSYSHFAEIASLVSTRGKDDIKGAIVTLESGPVNKGRITYGCSPISLSDGYFPFRGHARLFMFLMVALAAVGGWLIRLSFK